MRIMEGDDRDQLWNGLKVTVGDTKVMVKEEKGKGRAVVINEETALAGLLSDSEEDEDDAMDDEVCRD